MNNLKERIRMQQHIIDKQDAKIKKLEDSLLKLYSEHLIASTEYKKELDDLKSRKLFARVFNK